MSLLRRFMQCAALSASLLAAPALAGANEVVCRIPSGGAGITFADENTQELRAWGPGGLEVAPDGSFWIADTAARRLLHYSKDCTQLGIIELKNVVGVTDLVVTNDAIYALDVAAGQPTVLHLSPSGAEYGRYPVDQSITGLTAGETGELLVERQFGASFDQLLDRNGRLAKASLPGLSQAGVLYTARAADLSQKEAHAGTLTVGGQPLEVSVPNDLGGLRVLGMSKTGDVLVKLEEVALVSDFRVDQTVRRYSHEGKLLGAARVPLANRYTYVQSNVATTPAGDAFILHTTREGAEIQKLVFTQELPAVLPLVKETREDVAPPSKTCRAANDMALTGNHFTDFVRGYSNTNVNGACAGRTKPRFLTQVNVGYAGVAYDWGGFDSVATYDSNLYAGYTAGDINTAGVESCSRGVDCSGFVSRAWGTASKYGTSTLPNISWQLGNRSSMAKGDIMNCAGSHVTMFDYYITNGIYTWEATTSNGYDRAVHLGRDWSYFSSCYVPRRYNSKC